MTLKSGRAAELQEQKEKRSNSKTIRVRVGRLTDLMDMSIDIFLEVRRYSLMSSNANHISLDSCTPPAVRPTPLVACFKAFSCYADDEKCPLSLGSCVPERGFRSATLPSLRN